MTTLVHGAAEAARAERAADVLFTEEIATLDEATLAAVLADAPSSPIGAAELDGGLLAQPTPWCAPAWPPPRATPAASSKAAASTSTTAANPRTAPSGDEDVIGRFVILRRGKTQHVLHLGD